MKQYIEREKLTKSLKIWQNTLIDIYGENDEYVRCLDSVLLGIDNATAADVRPVVRGEWGGELFDRKWKIVCSACGCFAEKMTDYCPNCGAEMR